MITFCSMVKSYFEFDFLLEVWSLKALYLNPYKPYAIKIQLLFSFILCIIKKKKIVSVRNSTILIFSKSLVILEYGEDWQRASKRTQCMNFGTMAESDAVTIMLSKIQSAKNFHSIHCSRALDFSTPHIVHPWVMSYD